MYNEKVLNSVQTWLPGFSAMYHYTTFDMASAAEATTLGGLLSEQGELSFLLFLGCMTATLHLVNEPHPHVPVNLTRNSTAAIVQE